MEDSVALAGAKRQIQSLQKRGRYKEAGCLKRRKKLAGFPVEDLCPRCGKEPEAALHRFWQCEHNNTLKSQWKPDKEEQDDEEEGRREKDHAEHEKEGKHKQDSSASNSAVGDKLSNLIMITLIPLTSWNPWTLSQGRCLAG